MGLGLTLTYCSPSLGQLVPVNVFQREFRATHAIERYVYMHCLFSHRSPFVHALEDTPFRYSSKWREVLEQYLLSCPCQ